MVVMDDKPYHPLFCALVVSMSCFALWWMMVYFFVQILGMVNFFAEILRW
jgi:hypothetical protein